MKFLVSIILLFVSSNLLAPEEFVVPKKKRVSTSALKEEIGQTLGTLIKDCAKNVGQASKIQYILIEKLSELLDQDQNSFFAKASGQQLQEYAKAIDNLANVMRDCQKKIQEAFSSLQQLEK